MDNDQPVTAPKVVLAFDTWATNADLIKDVARLGYLRSEWLTLDPTYGNGGFWKRWRPERLVRHDIVPAKAPDGVADFRNLPYADETFHAVVFDPPYALNGASQVEEFDHRYGIDEEMKWQERMQRCRDGITEAGRVTRRGGMVLVKCQSQVSSGAIRWQTYDFVRHAETCDLRLVDEFGLLGGGRPQPTTRPHKACSGDGCDSCDGGVIYPKQHHAYMRPSMLLVFKKARRLTHG